LVQVGNAYDHSIQLRLLLPELGHRGKIESTINNAKRAVELKEERGSLAAFVWQFEPQRRGRPAELPSQSPESVALSKALKERGRTFVGPTTVYAFIQATGMVNDHVEGCVVRPKVNAARRAFQRPN
jgi:DNA-3-methyladenine glycosylase I